MIRDTPETLRELAKRCRQMACGVSSRESADSLNRMAEDYARKAERLDSGPPGGPKG